MTIEHLNTTTTNKNGYKNFNLLTKPIKDYNHKKKSDNHLSQHDQYKQ